MNGAKKIGPVFDDQINAKIQRKFDLVFTEKTSPNTTFSNENGGDDFNESINFDIDEMVMERNDGSNKNDKSTPEIGLDFSMDDEAPVIPEKAGQLDLSSSDDDLGFSLDFDNEDAALDIPVKTAVTKSSSISNDMDGGFTLDDSDIGDVDFNADATQKTIVVNMAQLKQSNLNDFKLDKTSTNASVDMMSSEEVKANIESTIKDIIRPNLEGTTEIEVSKTHSGLSDIEDSELDFSNTPSRGFVLSEIDDGAFALDSTDSRNKTLATIEDDKNDGFDLDSPSVSSSISNPDSTGDFDINSLTMGTPQEVEEDAATRIADFSFTEAPVPAPKAEPVQYREPPKVHEAEISTPTPMPTSAGMGGTSLNAEDSMRFQATIRALREEREEMLLQIKNLKSDSKELEQDNLTLKANLDEAKIEITILRKRQMVELEDLKYRLALSEEKKAMSVELAKQADMRREKLEQKVRIDFNQVKQREKELESKLELLSMDVDSQVQSRDQKILELRRKIDALEFNMENASIKEQKSLDDKRKLEDRLNKIMKTLRHSIKNLEDDIDQVEDENDHQKDKN
ncbi:hypothetical protein SHI21_08995 [Bacteriovorax sp. PP10]|uniref:Uncharacterized protein n=1 Tax=Bacteriovorax antarcticus TaxID=3088717 RepID=A0ABU5VTT5_9BACT|nr:hypothetical protein [Bacteriovorax sp. PP10]MEA9356337.1 hypothetical protein [Bacteriovorax sp. PP10]